MSPTREAPLRPPLVQNSRVRARCSQEDRGQDELGAVVTKMALWAEDVGFEGERLWWAG